MSPLQIATTSALLLACVYLSLGAHIPARRDTSTVTAATETEVIYKKNVASRTGTEAATAKYQVDQYIKKVTDCSNVTAECSALLDSINLPRPQNVPNCASKECMVNVSINLQYLLHMYSHVLGLIYQKSTTETVQMQRLDLLEMMYHRMFSQTQRYLQAHKLTSGNDFVSFNSSEDPNLEPTQYVKVVLCRLRQMAKRAMDIIGKENINLYAYKFCRSVQLANC